MIMQGSKFKSPGWFRILQIVFGVIAVGLSIGVLAFPTGTIATIVILLSIGLIFVGIERIAAGISAASASKTSRFANIVLGIIVIGLATVVMAYPVQAGAFLIFFGALALLFNGIARLIHGFVDKNNKGWARAALIATGIISIAIASAVLAHPVGIGIPLLAFLLSIGLLIVGLEMIALGVSGRRRVGSREVQESMR
jgi:uncharacterized membrane protein HdeD (DUF308 family)